ncbi:MAG: tyrosine-type recombinase/integrase [Spirochaetia bacterium]
MLFERRVFDYLISLVAKGHAQETIRWRKRPLPIFGRYLAGRRITAPAQDRATARSGAGRRVSPHTFRHSMAPHMLRKHADLRHIQAILGRTSLRSTQIYTHSDIEDLKE